MTFNCQQYTVNRRVPVWGVRRAWHTGYRSGAPATNPSGSRSPGSGRQRPSHRRAGVLCAGSCDPW